MNQTISNFVQRLGLLAGTAIIAVLSSCGNGNHSNKGESGYSSNTTTSVVSPRKNSRGTGWKSHQLQKPNVKRLEQIGYVSNGRSDQLVFINKTAVQFNAYGDVVQNQYESSDYVDITTFDEEGRTLSHVHTGYGRWGSSWESGYEYETQGQRIYQKGYRINSGVRTTIPKRLYQELDQTGLLLKEYDEDGVLREEWVIGGQGDVHIFYNSPRVKDCEQYYNSKAQLIEVKRYNENGRSLESDTKFEYDERGNCIREMDSVSGEEITCTFSANNEELSRKRFDKGILEYSTTTTYDMFGNPSKEVSTYGSRSSTKTYRYEYDQYNNWIARLIQAEDGTLVHIRKISYKDGSHSSGYNSDIVVKYAIVP